MIKWGMIGCGDVTERKSGPAFNKVDNSELIAVMSRTYSKVKDYAERHKIDFYTDKIDDLLKINEINAIYIATPPDSHLYYTKLVAEAGKHVYVEKPMALDYSECLEMIDVCKKNDVKLFPAYYRRRLPKFIKVKELIEAKSIGEIKHILIELISPPHQQDLQKENLPWRVKPEYSGGGYFMDMGSHQLDLVDYYFGEIKDVSASVKNYSGLYPADDYVSGRFITDSGVVITGVWDFAAHTSQEKDLFKISGTEGTITFSSFTTDEIILENKNGIKKYSEPFPESVHFHLIDSVVKELLGGEPSPSTGESGARTNLVIDKVYGRL
ncbi:MAG: Gfo/Idh/MocA family oxidoreductase [Melioribacteraceae bacterium]|nr:Gfo/Idh/MocA family oxidoreductase [Melioribacteraceae bacterium]